MDALDNTDSGDDSASPRKEKDEKRHSFMGDELLNFETVDLEDDGWHDVFDEGEEASVDEDASAASDSSGAGPSSKSPTNEPLTDSQQSSPLSNTTAGKLDTSTTATGTDSTNDDNNPLIGISISSKGLLDATKQPPGTSTADTTKSEKPKNGASSAVTYGNWHDPVLDKPHREKMINDIVQMLFARKKEKNPDEKWVARLKAQARAFESQLYKNASSLESYNDRTTLKRRIAKLADAFASYFKQAKQRKNFLQTSSSNRSNTSALISMDTNLTDVDLQPRSMDSLPNSLAGNLRRQQSLPAPSNSVTTLPGPLMNNLSRAQSESLVQTATNFNRPSGSSNISSSMVPGNFNSMMGNNLVGMMGNTMGMQQQQQQQSNNQQLQQQLLASIQQQQQQVMARQMAMGGGQAQGPGNMMSGQAGMMPNNGMSILNQMQQQQQQNPMLMNLMQQQQNLLQQQPNSMGLNMMQNPNAAMMMGNNAMNAMNMNIIPGTSMAGVVNMQGMNFGNDSMLGSQEMLTMPPPGMMNNTGMPGMSNRQPGMNDDTSPLSPGSFHW